jgi:arylsulfatase A-like enzyme
MRPNLLLVMVDAFRADRAWGVERGCVTPFLDKLTGRSTSFTNVFAPASMTTCCTATLLTGTYPFVHGIRSLSDARLSPELPTLAELFKRNGFHTWAEVTGPLVPLTGLDRGFDEYVHRGHTETLDGAWGAGLREKVTAAQAPWFGFVHLWELHNPRRVPPEFDRPEYGRTLYDRAVSALDRQLEFLVGALPPDTAVVLTGDHGEFVSASRGGNIVGRLKRPLKWARRNLPGARTVKRLTPGLMRQADRLTRGGQDLYMNWLGHGYHVYDYLVHVPLLVYAPGVFPSGVRVSELASHVDVYPTLASAFELDAVDGRPRQGIDLQAVASAAGAYAPAADSSTRAVYLEASGGRMLPRPDQWLTAIRTERYKYVRGLVNEALPEELYDLAADPGEHENLVGARPDVAAELRQRLAALVATGAQAAPAEEAAYSAEEQQVLQERLRDLGYMD